MTYENPDTSPDELKDFIQKIKQLRGDPGDWMIKENVLSRFMADFGPHIRVFCRGEYRTIDFHAPAILTYNSLLGETIISFCRHSDAGIEKGVIHNFWSDIPYSSIARDVLNNVIDTRNGGKICP